MATGLEGSTEEGRVELGGIGEDIRMMQGSELGMHGAP